MAHRPMPNDTAPVLCGPQEVMAVTTGQRYALALHFLAETS